MKQFTVRQIGTMEMDKDGMYVYATLVAMASTH